MTIKAKILLAISFSLAWLGDATVARAEAIYCNPGDQFCRSSDGKIFKETGQDHQEFYYYAGKYLRDEQTQVCQQLATSYAGQGVQIGSAFPLFPDGVPDANSVPIGYYYRSVPRREMQNGLPVVYPALCPGPTTIDPQTDPAAAINSCWDNGYYDCLNAHQCFVEDCGNYYCDPACYTVCPEIWNDFANTLVDTLCALTTYVYTGQGGGWTSYPRKISINGQGKVTVDNGLVLFEEEINAGYSGYLLAPADATISINAIPEVKWALDYYDLRELDGSQTIFTSEELDGNPLQVQLHIGDALFAIFAADKDQDTIPNSRDNCAGKYNKGQKNSDTDRWGDACDNCPLLDNGDQADTDKDGFGDVCDDCPYDILKIEPGLCGCGIPDLIWYRDADGDNFGDPGNMKVDCDQPAGYVSNNMDCNDADHNEHPGQTWYKDFDNDRFSDGTTITSCTRPTGFKIKDELISIIGDCDDTDPNIQDEVITTYYRDADGDAFGDPASSVQACVQPPGYVSNNTDCNDIDPNIQEGAITPYYRDMDTDSFGDPSNMKVACDQPAGYVSNNMDCNDTDDNERPGQTWYKDSDNDRFSDGTTITSCTKPTGYKVASDLTATSGDCNDTDITIHPGVTYYHDADGDGFGNLSVTTQACVQPSGYVNNGADCNDTDVNEHPGQTWYKDADNDGHSDGTINTTSCTRPVGYKVAGELAATSGDCNDTDITIHPGVTYYRDVDGDGFGNLTVTTQACDQPAGYVSNNTDCNDTDANEHPGQTWFKDADNDGHSDGTTNTTSCTRPSDYKAASELTATSGDCNDTDATIWPGGVDIACDGIDQNCDGADAKISPRLLTSPIPHDQAGMAPDATRIAPDTSVAVLVENANCIDLTDPTSVKFSVTVNAPPSYERILANIDSVGITRIEDGPDGTIRFWAAYHRATDMLGLYPYDANVSWGFAVHTMDGSSTSASSSFKVESLAQKSEDDAKRPPATPLASGDPALEPATGLNAGVRVMAGALTGATIVYNPGEAVTPYVSTPAELPVFSAPTAHSVGLPLNLQPPTVFKTPVKLLVPVGGADPTALSLYLYNGVQWVEACDAAGNVTPDGVGWIVKGSRVNHTATGFIEVRVYHFSGIQAVGQGGCTIADLDCDHDSDGKDLGLLLNEFGRTNCQSVGCYADLNHDGKVDNLDAEHFAKVFGW